MGNNGKLQMVTLEGIITAADWDDDNNVIAVLLCTPDEDEYLIEDNERGEELLDLVSQNVMVTGILEEDDYGDKIIDIKSYEIYEEA